MEMKKLYEKERDSLLELIEHNIEWQVTRDYNVKEIQSGSQLEVQIYETWPTGAANKGKAQRISRPAQQKLYEKYRQQRVVRLVNANFTEKDTWLTLTYSDENKPADRQRAQRIIYNYLRSVRRKFKDVDVKAVYTTQIGEHRCHHHLCINISDRDRLEEMWCSRSERARRRKNPNYKIKKYGRTHARRLQADDFGFTGMALYVGRHGQYHTFGKLAQPKEKKTKTLKGRKLTRAFVKKLAEDKAAAKMEFLKLFPNCQFNDIDIRQTPYTRGYYIYARLKIIDDSGG